MSIYKLFILYIFSFCPPAHAPIHLTRHTYGCLQLNNGTPLHVVQHMLGHKNITTTEVYAKMNDEQKMQTVSRITLKHD
jgi:site-specific recombinase XerD